MAFWRSLNIAFMFLSRLPMPALQEFREEDQKNAGLLFPLVGLLLGIILALCAMLLETIFPAAICAALLLSLWVFITGGLHIDGLADSADAWLGGLADKERSLAIMKDPRCGSGALFTVGCLLILKFAALQTLFSQNDLSMQALMAVLVLGRCSALATFRFCPYVSTSGSALGFLDLSKPNKISMQLAIYISLSILLWPAPALSLLGVLAIWFALRHMMLQRLGGCTGDTAGASVEIIETTALLILCISW